MTEPYYQDKLTKLYNSDCRSMSELPDETVQCVVTSPPYWGLRKYEGDQELIWGGDASCEHEWGDNLHRAGYRASDTNPGKLQSMATQNRNVGHSNFCQKCGAWKGSFGLEPTPELYVQHTVEIMQEIKRVLRKDGVCFLNLGDSYFASGGAHKPEHANPGLSKSAQRGGVPHGGQNHPNLKPKDMCLIPFRVAIALQDAGWWVRSVIIWQKKNPMPESVQDRPTNAHEYILMLTKSKKYYYDVDAVREKLSPTTMPRLLRGVSNTHKNINGAPGQTPHTMSQHREHGEGYANINPAGRNLRDVWTFPTQPFPGAHFAVFPEKLPELCIKAATSEKGCCPKCGAPWARVIDRDNYQKHESEYQSKEVRGINADRSKHSPPVDTKTIGWKPTCNCGLDPIPCTVLDPFAGSGTSLLVAKKLQRKAVGYELSRDYCKLDEARIRSYMPLWNEVK